MGERLNKKHFFSILEYCENKIPDKFGNDICRFDFSSKLFAEGILSDLNLIPDYVPENSKVLDFGCGKGHISILLSEMGFCASATDIGETVGEHLGISESLWQKEIWNVFNKDYNINYLFYNGTSLPFKDNSYDAIVAYAVIEHIPPEHLGHILDELNRILKKGGYLFVYRCPRKYAFIEHLARILKMTGHDILISDSELQDLLSNHGFDMIKIEKTDMIPAFLHNYYLQKFWQSLTPVLLFAEKILMKTPVSIISHHNRCVALKGSGEN
ncbi:class I SAM-dependent methyltransferase [Candidatus Pacearchaeota archaeon]|nr:class I SAM-dependent methyltransferase [Candidatus Pacearchaeota archaeon]